jgi:hypothetical protein
MNRFITSIALLALAAGCATTGSTLRSGVGDRQLEHPPYYAGIIASSQTRIVHLPIDYQRGASQPALFDPSDGAASAVSAFLEEMNAFIDSVRAGTALRVARTAAAVPPDVYFGCERDATDDCVERGDSVLGRRGTAMRLAIERPSRAWIERAAIALDSVGATHALVLTLEIGQYWARQNGVLGRKTVELGTNYVENLPWLTSLEQPVTVLQITGALIGRDGKAVRIGAEGLLAQPTRLVESSVGLQRLITAEQVNRARSLRHTQRPEQPLAWQLAICQLLNQLAGAGCPSFVGLDAR